MAIIRSTQYPNRWNPPTGDAPQGSGKNRTSSGSNDGSYFDQVWFNDADSLHQALFIASGISPNGTQDIGTESQIFDALVNNRWSSIGNYSVGTIVTGSNGKQYYCNNANGRDTSPVDPTTDSLDFWRQYPYEEVIEPSGMARKFFDGYCEQYGSVSDPTGTGVTVTYPVGLISTPEYISVSSASTGPAFSVYTNASSLSVEISKWQATTGAKIDGVSSWAVKGRWA